MAYVQVPRDITQVKPKLIFNLTSRQFICFGLAALVGIPTFLAARSMGNQIAILLLFISAAPFFFFAIYNKDGIPAEKYLLYIIRARFVYPSIRIYATANVYAQIGEEDTLEETGPADNDVNDSVVLDENEREPQEQGN